MTQVQASDGNGAVDAVEIRMQLHEPQPGFQALIKAVGGTKCDAERVHRVRVERDSHEAISIRFYGAAELSEHERDVAKGTRQQIRPGFQFADAFRVRLPQPPNSRSRSLRTRLAV